MERTEDELPIGVVIEVFRRNWILLLAVPLAVGILVFTYLMSRPKMYVSSYMLRVPGGVPGDLTLPVYKAAVEIKGTVKVTIVGDAITFHAVANGANDVISDIQIASSAIQNAVQQVVQQEIRKVADKEGVINKALSAGGAAALTALQIEGQLSVRRGYIATLEGWLLAEKRREPEASTQRRSPFVDASLVVIGLALLFYIALIIATERRARYASK